jgi:hypothetical protein
LIAIGYTYTDNAGPKKSRFRETKETIMRSPSAWKKQCRRALRKARERANGHGVTVRIPLTRGLSTVIDEADFERVKEAGPWCAQPHGLGYRAVRGLWKNGRVEVQFLHRFLLEAPPGVPVHHRSTDGLDNTRANLYMQEEE